jgi:hypothetical protein
MEMRKRTSSALPLMAAKCIGVVPLRSRRSNCGGEARQSLSYTMGMTQLRGPGVYCTAHSTASQHKRFVESEAAYDRVVTPRVQKQEDWQMPMLRCVHDGSPSLLVSLYMAMLIKSQETLVENTFSSA